MGWRKDGGRHSWKIWVWLGSHGKMMGAGTSLVYDFLYHIEPGRLGLAKQDRVDASFRLLLKLVLLPGYERRGPGPNMQCGGHRSLYGATPQSHSFE